MSQITPRSTTESLPAEQQLGVEGRGRADKRLEGRGQAHHATPQCTPRALLQIPTTKGRQQVLHQQGKETV